MSERGSASPEVTLAAMAMVTHSKAVRVAETFTEESAAIQSLRGVVPARL